MSEVGDVLGEIEAEDGCGSDRDEVRIGSDRKGVDNDVGLVELSVVDDDDILGECAPVVSHDEPERDNRVFRVRLIGLFPGDEESFTGSIPEVDVFVVVRRDALRLDHLAVDMLADKHPESSRLKGIRTYRYRVSNRDRDERSFGNTEVDFGEVEDLSHGHGCASFQNKAYTPRMVYRG